MGLDIRIPIGGMFTLFGLMLVVYGLCTHGAQMYDRSLGCNVNIWWGLVMLVFGGLMLYFGVRKKPVAGPAASSDAGPPRRSTQR